MGKGVVADGVPGAGNFAGNVGMLLGVAADHEESCLHVVLGENFQQSQGVGIVRAVVVGESDLLCAARETGESFSIPLASGSHRLVTGRGSGRRGCCDGAGYGERKHDGIVNCRAYLRNSCSAKGAVR